MKHVEVFKRTVFSLKETYFLKHNNKFKTSQKKFKRNKKKMHVRHLKESSFLRKRMYVIIIQISLSNTIRNILKHTIFSLKRKYFGSTRINIDIIHIKQVQNN